MVEEPERAKAKAADRATGRSRAAGLKQGLRNFLRVMRANPLTMIGFILVLIITLTAVYLVVGPPVAGALLGHPVMVTPYDPYAPDTSGCPVINNVTICAQPPSAQHWLGTDNLGRDMFSRILAALPLDLFIAFSVAGVSLLIGGGLGLVAGFWDKPGTIGGVVSLVIMRLTDIFLAFPSLVLALAIAASLGRGTGPSILAILLTWWPFYVRLTRGEVIAVKHQPYVTAARAAGVGEWRILSRHVFRNILEPLIVYFTLDVGTVIIIFSTISFIGIGVPLDVAEWGNMVEGYEKLLLTAPWTVLSAGGAIFVTVLAFSLLGDGLRDILDPRSRRALTQAAATGKIGAQGGVGHVEGA